MFVVGKHVEPSRHVLHDLCSFRLRKYINQPNNYFILAISIKMISYILVLTLFTTLLHHAFAIAPHQLSSQHSSPLRTYMKSTHERIKLTRHYIVSKAEKIVKVIELNNFEICICGAVATALGDLSLHPLDTIKTVQQAASTPISAIKAFHQVITSSGIPGLYSGVVPYLLGDGLSGAVKFATFESSKKWVNNNIPEKYHGAAEFICAAGAFLVCSFILVPGEVLKIRLQGGASTSLDGVVKSIFKSEGLGGFYKGYGATLMRDIPYTMLELGIYENIKRWYRKSKRCDTNDGKLTTRQELTAGLITGVVTGFMTTPLDTIKTKMMIGESSSSIINLFKSTYQSGGMEGLFAGGVARVAWISPFCVIYLQAYEVLKRAFQASHIQ
jgi:solute carrier family 25 (mitochondrial S-adenosylmethionine transporter), member 26